MKKYNNAVVKNTSNPDDSIVLKYSIKKGFYPEDPNVIADVWNACNCNVKKVCEAFGIAQRTWYAWSNKPEIKEVLEVQREVFLDIAEKNLIDKLNEGDWKATEFVLKMRGKNRGYSEKSEVIHSGEVAHKLIPVINYILPTPEVEEIPTIEIKNNDDDCNQQ